MREYLSNTGSVCQSLCIHYISMPYINLHNGRNNCLYYNKSIFATLSDYYITLDSHIEYQFWMIGILIS